MSKMNVNYDRLKIGTRILFFQNMRPFTGTVVAKRTNGIILNDIHGKDMFGSSNSRVIRTRFCIIDEITGTRYDPFTNTVFINADSDWIPTGEYELPSSMDVFEERWVGAIMHSCVSPTDMNRVNIDRFLKLFPKRKIELSDRNGMQSKLPVAADVLSYATNIHFTVSNQESLFKMVQFDEYGKSKYVAYVVGITGAPYNYFVYFMNNTNDGNPKRIITKMINKDYDFIDDADEIKRYIRIAENLSDTDDIDYILRDDMNEENITSIWDMSPITWKHYEDAINLTDPNLDMSYFTKIF